MVKNKASQNNLNHLILLVLLLSLEHVELVGEAKSSII